MLEANARVEPKEVLQMQHQAYDLLTTVSVGLFLDSRLLIYPNFAVLHGAAAAAESEADTEADKLNRTLADALQMLAK